MRNALTYARDFDALVVHHVEDADLAGGGVMNEGETATRLGLPGVPREAETIMLDRDIRLARLTGGRYHAAQISCAPAVAALRRAKHAGNGVTAGAAIAHLALNENDVGAYRTFFKMSPPLRSEDDRQALVEALADGTIDVVCSAHDPQDVEGKRQPFAEAADGAVGLETMLVGRAAARPFRRRVALSPDRRDEHAAREAARPRRRHARARRAGRPDRRRSRPALDRQGGGAALALAQHRFRRARA